jgi:hypothetical protein
MFYYYKKWKCCLNTPVLAWLLQQKKFLLYPAILFSLQQLLQTAILIIPKCKLLFEGTNIGFFLKKCNRLHFFRKKIIFVFFAIKVTSCDLNFLMPALKTLCTH